MPKRIGTKARKSSPFHREKRRFRTSLACPGLGALRTRAVDARIDGPRYVSAIGYLEWDVRDLMVDWQRRMADREVDKALIRVLRQVNAARISPSRAPAEEEELDPLRSASHRLAVYGSLAPGEPNHSVIEGIRGVWTDGFVRGRLKRTGWGSGIGYPAISWDPEGDRVRVKMLVSPELPEHWKRLDEFEGAEYARILLPVEDKDGGLIAVANIYALA